MKYVLYFTKGGKQELENVQTVQQHKTKIVFICTDGSRIEVLRKFILHTELIEEKHLAHTETVQSVFNRFDHFVGNLINQVEQDFSHSRYTISISELQRFRAMMNNCRKANLKDAISLKP